MKGGEEGQGLCHGTADQQNHIKHFKVFCGSCPPTEQITVPATIAESYSESVGKSLFNNYSIELRRRCHPVPSVLIVILLPLNKYLARQQQNERTEMDSIFL